ncbi:CcdC protein domain-containing protein [Stenotrophomonas sp. UBA7606]|uniref:CcdC protein domain-containing protein n=1 Tax=Stenotrophomonas sp. UBA7606 TaxID=1947559 RepID=UPI0025F757B4|nr:CcdC protein domain-containing protein [Stenotrophomonas sp. UBA7606]
MPVLFALPLAILVFVAIMLLLMPLSLWQRVRNGSARRQARPWLISFNFWATLVSTGLFALFAGIAGFWWPGAWSYAALGWLAGLLLGVLGHVLTRFEAGPEALHYKPNTALVLALTAMIVVRVVAGFVQGWQASVNGLPWPDSGWLSHAGLLAMAALLLGYAGMYGWLLRRRIGRHLRYRGYDRSPR